MQRSRVRPAIGPSRNARFFLPFCLQECRRKEKEGGRSTRAVPDLSARPYPRVSREPMALSERDDDEVVRSQRRAEESKRPCGNKTKIRREATVGTIISARDSSAAAVDSPRRDGALISGGRRFVFPGRPASAGSRDSALYALSARAQPDCSYRARRPACRFFLPRVSSSLSISKFLRPSVDGHRAVVYLFAGV